MTDNAAIRTRLAAQRRALDPAEVTEASAAVTSQLRSSGWFDQPGPFALYAGSDGEIDPRGLLGGTTPARWTAPAVVGDAMEFRECSPQAGWTDGAFGLSEPTGPPIATGSLSVALVPLVAFTSGLDRVGRGRGYYDRAFAHLNGVESAHRATLLVGLAHDFQEVDEVAVNEWDVALDAVVTPTRWLGHSPTGAATTAADRPDLTN